MAARVPFFKFKIAHYQTFYMPSIADVRELLPARRDADVGIITLGY
jgi:hypothetical protein